MQAQGLGEEHTKRVEQVTNQEKTNIKKQPSAAPEAHTQTPSADAAPHTQTNTTTLTVDSHHVNKAMIAVGALGLAGFILWMR